jgi:hypothetical protein
VTQISTRIPKRTMRQGLGQRPWRSLSVQLLGPITIIGGLMWAVAQPYRIVFLHRHGRDLYDYFTQGPMLVIVVGFVFAILIAPGIVADLESESTDGPAG